MKPVKSNVHTHTVFCDGRDTPREMAEEALRRGFCSLGFSSHSPIHYESSWGMRDEQGYLQEIASLKEEYRGRLEIACGIEWDLDSAIDPGRYDYTISSVHQIHHEGKVYALDLSADALKRCADECFEGDFDRLSRAYYQLVTQAALRPGVDIVGHLDLITKFTDRKWLFSEGFEFSEPAITAIDKISVARPDMIFEINTGAMARSGRNTPYPRYYLIKYLKAKNMAVTITSDCHDKNFLEVGFATAVRELRRAGYQQVKIWKNGAFTDLPLSALAAALA